MKKHFFLASLLLLVGNVAQAAHTVSLGWTETTPSVTFNVYRATVSGVTCTGSGGSAASCYSRIATNIATMSYVDGSVLSGVKYFYVITAVDAGGNESLVSNEATAVIPTAPNPPVQLAPQIH